MASEPSRGREERWFDKARPRAGDWRKDVGVGMSNGEGGGDGVPV